jgi:hypothetical protein
VVCPPRHELPRTGAGPEKGLHIWPRAASLLLLVTLVVSPCAADDLVLQKAGTADAYITYKGKPLFAFAPTGDSDIGRPRDGDLDLVAWADWCKARGMNHLRSIVPLAFGRVDNWYREAGKPPVYHYRGAPGQFDLDHFNQPAWDLIDSQVRALRDRGVIIQISLFTGLELRPANEWSQWGKHYFNPKNNKNAYTDKLSADTIGISPFMDEAIKAKKRGDPRLLNAQKRFVRKVLDHTATHGNCLIDIGHEIGVVSNWLWGIGTPYTQAWLNEIIHTVRSWESDNGKKLLLTMDATYIRDARWVFAHPELDLILWGRPHRPGDIFSWRQTYKKPYVADEAWDENGEKFWFHLGEPHYTAARRYILKMMARRVQTANIYQGFDILGQYRGMGFEIYAPRIREIWNLLTDYANMQVVEHHNKSPKIAASPGGKEHMLESAKEVLVYLETGAGTENNGKFIPSGDLELNNLVMTDGEVDYTIYAPKSGKKATGKRHVHGGTITFALPKAEEGMVVFFTK